MVFHYICQLLVISFSWYQGKWFIMNKSTDFKSLMHLNRYYCTVPKCASNTHYPLSILFSLINFSYVVKEQRKFHVSDNWKHNMNSKYFDVQIRMKMICINYSSSLIIHWKKIRQVLFQFAYETGNEIIDNTNNKYKRINFSSSKHFTNWVFKRLNWDVKHHYVHSLLIK